MSGKQDKSIKLFQVIPSSADGIGWTNFWCKINSYLSNDRHLVASIPRRNRFQNPLNKFLFTETIFNQLLFWQKKLASCEFHLRGFIKLILVRRFLHAPFLFNDCPGQVANPGSLVFIFYFLSHKQRRRPLGNCAPPQFVLIFLLLLFVRASIKFDVVFVFRMSGFFSSKVRWLDVIIFRFSG